MAVKLEFGQKKYFLKLDNYFIQFS